MPRKNKNAHKIGPVEEIENAKALDAKAGVPTNSGVAKLVDAPPMREPSKEDSGRGGVQGESAQVALPHAGSSPAPATNLTYDSREKLLLKYAAEQWVDGFFADFTDTSELAELTCRLGVRVLASIICSKDPEFADTKDKIAAMRVVLNIEYGENASMSPEKFLPIPPVLAIPTGGTENIDASMEKFRKLSGKK